MAMLIVKRTQTDERDEVSVENPLPVSLELSPNVGILRTVKTVGLTIPNGQTTTDACDGQNVVAFGLVMPPALTSTTITFLVSADGGTFQALYDQFNAQVSMTVAASRSYDLPAELASWRYFKIVGGSTETALRSLIVVAKS